MEKLGTWKERIMFVFTGREKKGIWFSHKKIIEHLDCTNRNKPLSVTMYLLQLIRTGHLERAVKPAELRENDLYRPQVEYLYRWTGLKYVRPDNFTKIGGINSRVDPDAMRLGAEIWNNHPHLPKWFRDIMK